MAILYVPPKPAELAKLKADRNKTSSEMAELTGSTESRTRRKYTGGERTISAQTLFFLMTRLDLGKLCTTRSKGEVLFVTDGLSPAAAVGHVSLLT